MADENSLLFRIRGDASDLKRATSESRAAIRGLSSSTTAEFRRAGAINAAISRELTNQFSQLAQSAPLLGQPIANLTREILGFGPPLVKTTASIKNLTAEIKSSGRQNETAFRGFESALNKAFTGGTKRADDLRLLFTRLGIDVEKSLLQPRPAFDQFQTGLRGVRSETDRLALASNVYGSNLSKVIPVINGTGRSVDDLNKSLAAERAAVDAANAAALRKRATMLSLATGVGGAAIAIGAVAGGAFLLAKRAADAGSQIHDLARETSLSAETISALRVAAEKSGTTIEQVANAIGFFEKNLVEARDGNTELADSFRQLGIAVETGAERPQQALAQFLKRFNEIPGGAERAALATKLFGRGGRDLIATFDEVGGDLDAFIDRMRDAGLVMTDEAAKAADKFGDDLTEVGLKVSALANSIGRELTPSVSQLLDEVTKTSRASASEVSIAGEIIVPIIEGLTAVIRDLKAAVRFSKGELGFFDFLTGEGPAPDAIAPIATGSLLAPLKSSKGPAKADVERAKEAEAARKRALAAAQKARREAEEESRARIRILEIAAAQAAREFAQETEEERRQYELRRKSLEDFVKRNNLDSLKLLEAQRKRIDAEQREVERGTALQREKNIRLAELEEERERALAEHNARVTKNVDELDRAQETALREHLAALLEIQKTRDQVLIEQFQDAADKNVLSQEQATRAIGDVQRRFFDIRQEQLEVDQKNYADYTEEYRRLTIELNQLTEERKAFEERTSRARQEARRKDLERAREVANDIRALTSEVNRVALDLGRAAVEDLVIRGAGERRIIQARQDNETLAAIETNRLNKQDLLERKFSDLRKARTREEREEIEAKYAELFALEEERFRRERSNIDRRAQVDLERLNPTSSRSLFGDDFANQLTLVREQAALAGESISDLQAGLRAAGRTALDFFEEQSAAAGNFGTIAKGAFGNVVQGIGQLVSNYVLLGETGPAALRKLLAATLAQVAQEAAVKAIFELAAGFASLFVNPAAAAGHFTAAALYGAVAGVAAVTGRAAAGDLFKPRQERASVPGREGAASPSGVETIEQGRNQRPQVITIVLRPDEGFKDLVTARVVEDYRNAGPVYDLVNGGRP